MRVRKRPIEVDAHQWMKNGDHPDDYKNERPWIEEDDSVTTRPGSFFKEFMYEGEVVRYFRTPAPGDRICEHCGIIMFHHGWIDTKEGGHIVCPGDFIITGVKGEHYPCKPDIFEMTYEAVDGGSFVVEDVTVTLDPRQTVAGGSDEALFGGTQRRTATVLSAHVAQELNVAHKILDRLGAATTKVVPKRSGDGTQEITIGLAARIDDLQRKVFQAGFERGRAEGGKA